MTKPLGQLSQTEKSEKPEIRETYWTSTEKESLIESYGTEILVENGAPTDVMTKEAPTDARLIRYKVDGKDFLDVTRSAKAANIFDLYFDTYGKGTIKPALWGYNNSTAPKKKKRK